MFPTQRVDLSETAEKFYPLQTANKQGKEQTLSPNLRNEWHFLSHLE